MNPENVLVITFTNQAVEELKSRLKAESLEITTFHSFAVKILREQALEAGVHPQFTILDSTISQATLHNISKEHLLISGLMGFLSVGEIVDLFQKIALRGLEIETIRSNTEIERQKLPQKLDRIKHEIRSHLEELREICSDTTKNSKSKEKVLELLQEQEEIHALVNQLSLDMNLGLRICSILEQKFVGLQRINEPFKEVIDQLKSNITKCKGLVVENSSESRQREVFDLLGRIEDDYVEFKEKNQLLDYCDLEAKVLGLFRNKAWVREYYQGKYSHILVDEYQDTSLVQKEILGLLASKNICIVGDPKQSIYGFRHGTPEVLYLKEKNLEEIILTKNYRSHPDILRYVNAIMGRLIGENYYPLEGGLQESEGGVNVLTLPLANNREAEIELQAQAVANTIMNNGIEKCAVLLQTATHVPAIVKLLQKRGIPCNVIGHEGIFSSKVARDIVSFMELMKDDSKLLYWVEVLKNFLNYSHNELEEFVREHNKGKGISHTLKEHFGIKGLNTYGLITKYRSRYRLSRLQDLLFSWLVITKYLQKNSSKEEGTLQLILEKINFMKSDLGWSNDEILDTLKLAEVNHVTVNLPDKGKPMGVTVSTIHQAKGLEYPVVFLLDLKRNRPGLNEKFVLSESGVLVSKNLDSNSNAVTCSFLLEAEYFRLKSQLEDLRLFYVALTRAQKELYLVGNGEGFNVSKTLSEQSSWWSRINCFNSVTDENSRAPLFNRVVIDDKAYSHERNTSPQLKTQLQFNIYSQPNLKVQPSPLSDSNGSSILIQKGYVSKQMSQIVWSVSSLVAFEQCPKKFFFSAIKKFPPLQNYSSKGWTAANYGTFLHRVLEECSQGSFLEDAIKEATSQLFLPDRVVSIFTQKARQELKPIATKDLFCEGSQRVESEMPFYLRQGSDIIHGIIDRISYELDWIEVVDYKSNEKGKIKESDITQLEIYALAIKKLYPKQQLKASLVMLKTGHKEQLDRLDSRLKVRSRWLQETLEKIHHSRYESKCFPAVKNPGCYYCGYKKVCCTEIV